MAKKLPYYSFDMVESYDALFTLVCGARGLGKTYGAIKAAIKRNIDSGEEFIYVRRYKTEMSLAKPTFFDAVAQEFPTWQFRVNGNVGERAIAGDDKPEWVKVVTFIPLSVAHNVKSTAYPNVTRIIYDEFIPENGRYLQGEVRSLVNILSTVDRNQDRARVLMLANAVSIMNPYFAEWRINPSEANAKGIVKRARGEVVTHFPDSADFTDAIMQTRLGQFVANTDYASYAVHNVFSDNHAVLIGSKPSSAVYAFTLQTVGGRMSIWEDLGDDGWYVQEALPKVNSTVTLFPEMVTESTRLVTARDFTIARVRRAYAEGRCYFDTPRTRNLFIEMGKR